MSPHQNVADAAALAAVQGSGVVPGGPVHANCVASELVAHALRRGEGVLSADGGLVVQTGVHTGRSVADKFSVNDEAVTADMWWRHGNQKLAPASFEMLKARVQAYLQGRELFTQDLFAGADPATASACGSSAPRRGRPCSRATCSSARAARSWWGSSRIT